MGAPPLPPPPPLPASIETSSSSCTKVDEEATREQDVCRRNANLAWAAQELANRLADGLDSDAGYDDDDEDWHGSGRMGGPPPPCPPTPPQAFCDVPECDGPDPSELWPEMFQTEQRD